jgi:hypothetical protein
MCPLPEKNTGDNSPGPGGGVLNPVPVANPLAPLNIPVPPRMVIALVIVWLTSVGGPNRNTSVPVIVSAPPLKDAVKLLVTKPGANAPEGYMVNVIDPSSVYVALPKGTKVPDAKSMTPTVGVAGLGGPVKAEPPVIANVNGIVAAGTAAAEAIPASISATACTHTFDKV